MTYQELVGSISEKKTEICFVGGGGKTSLISSLARTVSAMGRKVLVTTTTHIVKPDRYYADSMDEVLCLWSKGNYAVIGTETAHNKLTSPNQSLYKLVSEQADLILIEADGSKRLPCKIPGNNEPVLTDHCDVVIGLMGMTAMGKPLQDVCFRFAVAGEWLGESGETILSPDIAAKILCDERGTRKDVNDKPYIIVLNQCDDDILSGYAKEIAAIAARNYDIPALCVSLLEYDVRERQWSDDEK